MSLIDDFAAYAKSPCYSSPEPYLWWSGLGLVSAVAGRSFWTFLRGGDDIQDRLFPNLFVALLGIPGAGKSTPIDEVKRFLTKLDIQMTPDHFTTQGVMKEVPKGAEPCFRCLPRSFSSLLDEHASQSIKTFLCDGYDCTPRYARTTISRGQEIVTRICFSMLTACTPSHLSSCFKRGDWQEGLPSRFIFVWGERNKERKMEESRDIVLENQILNGLRGLLLLSDLGQKVEWSNEAKAARQHWVKKSEGSMPVHMHVEGYWARREVTLTKIAVCIAIANLRFIVELEDWKLAVEKLEETEANIHIALGPSATNPYFQATQWLLRWLKSTNRIVTESELRQQMSWNFHPKDVETVIEDLERRGILCAEPLIGPGAPRRFQYRKEGAKAPTVDLHSQPILSPRPFQEATSALP